MSNLTNLNFIAPNIFGINYLSRILDVEVHLNFMNLGETIKKRK